MTRQTIDWEFIHGFESKFEDLVSKLSEQYWVLLNDGLEQDIAATEMKINSLFSDPILKSKVSAAISSINSCENHRDRRILELFEKVVLSETVGRSPQLTIIKNEIRQTSLGYMGEIDGKTHSTSELSIILRDSEDRRLRKKAYAALLDLSAVLEPKFRAGWNIYRENVRKLGFNSFIDFQLQAMEIDRDELHKTLDQFYEQIQPLRHNMINQVKMWAETMGIKGDDLQPWDTQYIINMAHKELKPYFPSYKAIDILLQTYRTLGYDIDTLPITIDSASKPHKKESFAFCANLNIPNDVRVSVSPYDGPQFYRILFHEYGHALHAAHIQEKDVFLKITDTPALNETMSLLSELIMCDSEWPQRFVHLDENLVSKYHLVNKINSLRWLYSILEGIQFESRVYDDPDCDSGSLRREISKRFGFFEFDTDFTMGEGEFIVFMESPLYLTGYFFANITAVQIYKHLCKDGSLFKEKPEHIGKFITDNFFRYGNCYPWYELRDRAIGEKPNMQEFVDHYQI